MEMLSQETVMPFLTLMRRYQEDGLGDPSISLPPTPAFHERSEPSTDLSTPVYANLSLLGSTSLRKKFHTQIDKLKKRRFSYS